MARGSARFTLDGETFDAPAGTYVFVADPSVHRHAVAAEPGTTVLSFGGPATFTPSAWEWSFRAANARTDPDRAREILADGFAHQPDSPSLHYELACLEASLGRRDEALAALRVAIDREPELKDAARDDDDFAGLRKDPDFVAVVTR
ncbi:MAG TPA: tetratricopeptide repeat protein [Solirubrobacteraceae bacterium]